jgi:ferredoxin
MKIHVDPDKCQGHTLCAMRAPHLFELSDIDGHSSEVTSVIPPGEEVAALEAVHSCPEQAIIAG